MNILVTGGAGFIGSNIVDRLIAEGHSVTIVDDLSTGKAENVNPKADFRRTSICSPDLEDVFRGRHFDAVYHLAAQIDVRKSTADPAMDAGINVIGGINVLRMMEKYRSGKLIYSSTGGEEDSRGRVAAGGPNGRLRGQQILPRALRGVFSQDCGA